MRIKLLSVKDLIILSLIIIFNLFILFYLKYSNQNLGFTDFKLTTIGNAANLAISVLIISGLIILSIRKIKISLQILYGLLILSTFLLFLVFILKIAKIPSQEYYFFSLSLIQVLIITIFGAFQFVQFFLVMIIWLQILNVNKLLYLRAFVNVIFIMLGLFLLTLIYINTNPIGVKDEINLSQTAEVGVVLGAAVWSENKPSPSLASRVDKAADLFNAGKLKKIQLTGGNAPGELSEAEVSLNYILGKGINQDNIWIEKKTTSTIEQVKFIKYELFKKIKKGNIIIISDKYHLKRVNEICRFFNLRAKFAASDLRLKSEKIIFYQLRECIALILFWLFAL